ncbi:cache domain-containing protein [Nocardioides panacisoli]|uniref:Cache domain-containing protein n=1 Tax=Nocardioides panacisoli TaxID=627624 RepID=A0ABP7IJJ1_9ACTN
MTTATNVSADTAAVLGALRDLATSVFGDVDRIAAATLEQLDPAGRRLSTSLRAIDEVTTRIVEQQGQPITGAGFVAAVGYLDDTRWWLEWFARGEGAKADRLASETNPQAPGFYDYEFLPWYVVPRDTGRRHVTGPYVDYLCTDDYTLTFTMPVVVDKTFAGVAGADVKVDTAETLLMPPLRAAGQRLAVVNAHGRIVASNSGRHVCGDLLADVDVPAAWQHGHPALHRLDDLPLAVADLG